MTDRDGEEDQPIAWVRPGGLLHHVLGPILHTLIHRPRSLHRPLERALRYLASNAQRAKPDRDCISGRLKLGLQHVHAAA